MASGQEVNGDKFGMYFRFFLNNGIFNGTY